jgi:hypothetical protein
MMFLPSESTQTVAYGQHVILLQNRGKSLEFVLEINELPRDSGNGLLNSFLDLSDTTAIESYARHNVRISPGLLESQIWQVGRRLCSGRRDEVLPSGPHTQDWPLSCL